MKRVVGIWDQKKSGGALGCFLIFLEELQIKRQVYDADEIHVIVSEDVDHLTKEIPLESKGFLSRLCLEDAKELSPLMTVLRSISFVDVCYKYSGCIEYQKLMEMFGVDAFLWPEFDELKPVTHNYDSTSRIQSYFQDKGSIPLISFKKELVSWAENYLVEKSGGKPVVAVHLKHNLNINGQSNASMEAWGTFFLEEKVQKHAHFVIVGDDPVSEQIRQVPNITIAQDDSLTLDCHLALIQTAEFFIGMMSGPSNMAIFGKKPYLIFKNPNHHATEMIAELGDGDHYLFANPNQRVLREWDTYEKLVGSFNNMIAKKEA
jgi:hypothetical protein